MKIPLTGITEKGKKPEFDNPEFAKQQFRAYEKWVCYIEEFQNSKTLRQLGYWHSVFVPAFIEAEKENGNLYSHDGAHWFIKSQCPLLQGTVYNETTGEKVLDYIESFESISKKKLSEVMEWMFQWGAEKYGIVISEAMRK